VQHEKVKFFKVCDKIQEDQRELRGEFIMNSKQRVLNAINFKIVDRIPYYYFGTGPINQKLSEAILEKGFKGSHHLENIKNENDPYISGKVEENTVIDAFDCDVYYIKPRFIQTPDFKRKEFEFGSIHAAIYDANGKILGKEEKFPLEDIEEVEEVLNSDKWPSPDWYEYKINPHLCEYIKDKAVVAYDMGILLLYAMGMRGMEEIMIDMAINKEITHAIFSKITEFNLIRTRRLLEANKGIIDIVGIGDDVASQRSLMMSLPMWREMIKPYLQKMVDLCKEYNVIPYYHGCGGFTELFDDFIEMGIKCVGKLQPEAHGNNFEDLVRNYGGKICLWGAIDAQHIAIEGNEAEVKEHIRHLLDINAGKGGFVIGPSHSFTSDTPIENILSIYHMLEHEQGARFC
jgi:uroporphyrinogen-III decarboxylase